VTLLDESHPLIRLALGDLTAVLPGTSACGRTHTRIKGFMGRADQATKVKGMFVRPEQIAAIKSRHKEVGRLRLVVSRAADQDAMTLFAETDVPGDTSLAESLAGSLSAVVRIRGEVALVPNSSLPNDGKVIEDRR
ncbi:MAG: phenylacetate--CoA ligase family protein, partial [Hyphomicrobiales bacterium]|nr:phenylacetate--CoA ligase family protein [Hyphomicrobiales bacterium]